MVYEVVLIPRVSTAWRLSQVLDHFFKTADNVGPRVSTKYLIDDIDDYQRTSTFDFHIHVLHILRHCFNILGLGWDVRIASRRFYFPFSALNDMSECIPRGVQFFSFRDTPTDEGYLPPEVFKLNACSLRAIETEDALSVHKYRTSPLNLTHLTIRNRNSTSSISPRFLPSLNHLRILYYPTIVFFQPIKDTLVSLHVDILGALQNLEVFGFSLSTRQDTSSSLVHSLRLKELYVIAHDSWALEQAFLDVGSHIGQFSADLFPALATITVSCDFPTVAAFHSKGDINRACEMLAQSLSSHDKRVTIDFAHS